MANGDDKLTVAALKLIGFLTENTTLFLDIKESVECVRDELMWIQSFLKDTEQKQGIDATTQKLIEDIRAIDEFYKAIERNEGPARELFDMRRAMRAITRSLCDIIRNVDSNNNTETSLANENIIDTQDIDIFDEKHFVGFDDDISLLNVELSEGKVGRVLSILGVGGLGKTSIARKLYDTNKSKFEAHAWICVSQKWSNEDLFYRIGKSLIIDQQEFAMSSWFPDMLPARIDFLSQQLRKMRCLLVLDGMWDKEACESIRSLLVNDTIGSRVIITTRSKFVAGLPADKENYVHKLPADKENYVHKLRHRTKDESWELFCKNVFPNQHSAYSPDMKEIGKQMLAKCDGLPLSILVLGGLLSNKQPDDWHVIKKRIWRVLSDESIHISDLLDLSYNELSRELKACFLYLGFFPEDYEFCSEKLIELWIFEDAIPRQEGRDLKELAESYITELHSRSLIQIRKSKCGLNSICHVHDYVRELAVKKANEHDSFHMIPDYKPVSTIMDVKKANDQHDSFPIIPDYKPVSNRMAVKKANEHDSFPIIPDYKPVSNRMAVKKANEHDSFPIIPDYKPVSTRMAVFRLKFERIRDKEGKVGQPWENISSIKPLTSKERELFAIKLLTAAVVDLLHAVEDEGKKDSPFQSILKRIKSPLTIITPRLDEISRLNEKIKQRTRTRIDNLFVLIRDGKELVVKCSEMHSAPYYAKRECLKLLLEWENNLLGYFVTALGLDQLEEFQLKSVQALNDLANILEAETQDQGHSYQNLTAREERARWALSTIRDENKKEDVLEYVDNLHKQYGDDVSTKCIVYNATGETVNLAETHDWLGNIGPAYYPSEIANGQWGGFIHVKTVGQQSGSIGAVVYRGKNLKDEYCDWMLSWSNPRIRLLLDGIHVYTEIREVKDYDQNYWGNVRETLNRRGKSHKIKSWNGCSSSMTSKTGDAVEVEVILALEEA